MYCTGFHSHSASHTGSRPWDGGACLAGRRAPSYLHERVCCPLSLCAGRFTLLSSVTVIWWSHPPALRQCRSRAVRRRHCVGGGAPVNFGRRRGGRPKKPGGGGGGGG